MPNGIDPTKIRTVFFDAVGTLIYPDPPATEVYHTAARQQVFAIDLPTIETRFRAAFQRQEQLDRRTGNRTDEAREQELWRTIVLEVFHDQPNPIAPFVSLWRHFASPSSWKCFPDVAPTLTHLRQHGIEIGIASNFDSRLRGIAAGLPELAECRLFAISSEIGWKKPAPQFFSALSAMTGRPAEQILIVGDDYENDYAGAREAGMQALLLDRGRAKPNAGVLHSLTELPGILAGDTCSSSIRK